MSSETTSDYLSGQAEDAVGLIHERPSGPRDMVLLARSMAAHGRLKEARQAYISALRKRPQDATSWLELAAVLEQQGDLNLAAGA